ncbi:prepilin-type N-terminal cleavage/methylation domain-containing protein [Leptospira ognonensis]|uniref:Prepilin-type N-terminal cleavage/methylation domain-containing protein n=1 Tax=Leptospira ognonensis TaxID=2484945 RepID=A0A4R9JYX9_9LEPT|nr:type II secretion system protein GspG [Leptospira ognonensis]TGL57425.1 prepilin-type N-terminal cleavage/methylation domain-containing protein [Leptospira ognonensis]
MKKFGRNRKLKEGLTLIELTVVILIIGSLMGILYAGFKNFGSGNDSQAKLKVQNDSRILEIKLREYFDKFSKYPTEEQGLRALIERPDDEEVAADYEPLIRDKSVLKDPWGTPYQLKYDENNTYQILTLGADKKEGGEGRNKDFNILDSEDYPTALK